MLHKIIVLFTLISALVATENVRYDDFALFKITPRETNQVKFLNELRKDRNYDFWKPPTKVGEYVSVVLPPEAKNGFENELKENNIVYEVMIDDIQKAIDDQKTIKRNKRDTSQRTELYWTNYQLLEDINAWFYDMERTYPGVVTVISGGQSWEGRNITGIKISHGSGRKAFVLEGGSVGADWLSPAAITYITNQLLHGDEEAVQYSHDFDWYIFPVANPDGYEYSQNSVRLWYKNRRQVTLANVGIDLTKNWNSQWGVSGGSFSSADNNYVGLGPFSEPETRSFSLFIESIGSDIAGFLSFRSFGQRLVLPFAHTTTPMYNYEDMLKVGRRAMGSLSVRYETSYLVGTSGQVADGSTGSIIDWVKYRFNPPVVAAFHLRDEGTWGYILPVVQVEPTCEETYDGVMAIVREAKFLNMV